MKKKKVFDKQEFYYYYYFRMQTIRSMSLTLWKRKEEKKRGVILKKMECAEVSAKERVRLRKKFEYEDNLIEDIERAKVKEDRRFKRLVERS